MPDESKTKEQLIVELCELHRKVADLRRSVEELSKIKESQESAERYQYILDNISDGVYKIDNRGYFTYLNSISLKRTGLSPDTCGSCHYLDVVIPEDHEFARANFERIMQGKEDPPHEYRIKGIDGRVYYREVKSKPIFEHGRVVEMLGISRDITDRKKTEEALLRSEEKYQSLLESISDGVFRLDASGHFLYMNRSGLKRIGLTGENLHTVRFLDMVALDEHKMVRTHFENAVKGKETPPFEIKYINPKGRTVYVEIKYRPIFKDRKVVGVSGISRDVTERKKAEEMILNAKTRLEQMVETRTKELQDKTEQLADRSRNLEEMSTAIDVLLKKIENDKKEIENNIRTNLEISLFPHLENLKNIKPSEAQKACITAMEQAVKSITTPFMQNLRAKLPNLSSKEMLVSSLIKDGRTTKEIATILNVSVKAVEFHRYNIRKKLRLTQSKSSLSAYLSHLFDH
jgi:PAS domain S-box-containing protein